MANVEAIAGIIRKITSDLYIQVEKDPASRRATDRRCTQVPADGPFRLLIYVSFLRLSSCSSPFCRFFSP
jgi:hypothetical protein